MTAIKAAFIGNDSEYGLATAAFDSLKRNGTPDKALAGFLDKLWGNPPLLRALFGTDIIREKALAYLQDRAADMAGVATVPGQPGGEVQQELERQNIRGLPESSEGDAVHCGVERQAMHGRSPSDPDERGAVHRLTESHNADGRPAFTPKPGVPRGADAIAMLNEQRFYQCKMNDGRRLPDLLMSELRDVAEREDSIGRRNRWLCDRISRYVANPAPGSRVRDNINAATFNLLLNEFRASNSKELFDA